MKSLLLGIYGNTENIDIERNLSIFNCEGKREIRNYQFSKFRLFCFEGSGIHIEDNDHFFLAISGNIYSNLDLLKNTQPDYLTALKALLNNVSGRFTFCFYDKATTRLYLCNDFFGLYPLFYYKNDEYLMFCNEYQPLLIQQNKALPVSVSKSKPYFEYGFTMDNSTFFQDVEMFNERQILQFSQNGFSFIDYTINDVKQNEKSYDEYLQDIYTSLNKAVTNSINTMKKPLVTLTGGLDTRIILALTEEKLREQINYLTFYLHPLNEKNDKDVLISKIIAEKYKLNHAVIPFEEKTQQFDYHYFDSIRNASDDYLTGQYGGELLSGILFNNVLPSQTNELLNKMSSGNISWAFNFIKHCSLAKSLNKKKRKQFYFNVLLKSFFTSIYDGSNGLWINPWSDFFRYTSPFADTDFLKVWFSIPEKYLFDNGQKLYFDFYSKYIPECKKIPTNSFLPNLSENGFNYYEEGVEQKKFKTNKSSNLSLESIKESPGFSIIPDKYKSAGYLSGENNKRRIIDFCIWYDYYLKVTSQ